MATQLSLIIPAYNEGGRLADGMARLRSAVTSGAIDPASTEFIVVDDGSTDDTAARAGALLADYPTVRIVQLPQNRGKGAAVRAGVAAAQGALIAFADADMAIDPHHTADFVAALASVHVAIGSRSATGASVDRPSLSRSVMNRAFNRLVNQVTRVSLADTQCGFKAFRAPAAKLLFEFSTTERFAFDVEILSLARRLHFTIAEVPVQWLRVRGSRVRPWVDTVSMARDVVRAGRGVGSAGAAPSWLVTLSQAPDAALLQHHLPPGLPLYRQPDGRLIVVCPLMDDVGVNRVGSSITAALPGVALRRGSVTVAQLGECTPLWLTHGEGAHMPFRS